MNKHYSTHDGASVHFSFNSSEGFDITEYLPDLSSPSLRYRCVKFIVLQTIQRVYKKPDEYVTALNNYSQFKDSLVPVFEELKAKSGRSNRVRKNYKEVLKRMGMSVPHHLILNGVLKELKKEFAQKRHKRICKHNVRYYENVVRSLYKASTHALINNNLTIS
eukprot:TRINITY_DN3839_c0_g1_i2.p1 TRINITY_DN3839_c0_g1~~TRINITY_DN3839_c0_g1_i2.p1  ORF type:complete len:163 (-),score=21.22 TRINITY_DN3839_c0_g1_i2:47-535(-)